MVFDKLHLVATMVLLFYLLKMSAYSFRIIIEPDDPDGFHAFVPILGVHTCGKTLAEAKKNLNEAIICHIQGLAKDGVRILKSVLHTK